jgi:hypothetical protein
MKKLISLLSAAAMLAGMTTMTALADSQVYGDFDGSGAVDYDDSLNLVEDFFEYFFNTGKLDYSGVKDFIISKHNMTEEQYMAADCDGNGVVDLMDFSYLRMFALAKEYNYPGEWSKDNYKDIFAYACKVEDENYLVWDDVYNKYVSDKTQWTKNHIDANMFYVSTSDKQGGAIEATKSGYLIDQGRYVDIKLNDGSYGTFWISNELASGDVNFDGSVDALDATEVLKTYAQILLDDDLNGAAGDTTESFICSDYNSDGVVDSLDATKILVDYAEELNK